MIEFGPGPCLDQEARRMEPDRVWCRWAVDRIAADVRRTSDTHLVALDLPALPGIHVYLKDESTHPTGSLKHRLARSLFLFAIVNGWIRQGTPVIEASSGSTAVSEAYFARLLGLPFVAVIPRGTSPEKIAAIAHHGGRTHAVDDPRDLVSEAARLAAETGGHFMDQFTYAERATDWRGNNNIAESIFHQMAREPHPVPRWVVMSAGTGGTSATIGRYVRYLGLPTRLCVVDVERSVFFDAWRTGDRALTIPQGSRIEGIGRPRCEPSFVPSVVDRMERVPDVVSLATMRVLARRLGRRPGGSTGTNLYGLLRIAAEMRNAGEGGSLVTLVCDAGERYAGTYYDDDWVAAQGFDLRPHMERVDRFLDGGDWIEAE